MPCSLHAQDIIIKRDTVKCKILKVLPQQVVYSYTDNSGQELTDSMVRNQFDTVLYNQYEPVKAPVATPEVASVASPTPEVPKEHPLKFTANFGFNISHILEYNSDVDTNKAKSSMAGSASVDLYLKYEKEGSRFQMSNELHWLFSLQKADLKNADRIQLVNEEFRTLHDYSFGISRNNKWSLNVITNFTTTLFTQYGSYFKNYDSTGKTKGFLSPYSLTIAPGIKCEPIKGLKISLSPYSMNIYGVKDDEIANKGIYITDTNADHTYKRVLYKPHGAETNIWYDATVGNWLVITWRLGISYDYTSTTDHKALMDGLFITSIKLYKNIYLTHNGVLKGDLLQTQLKPYYSQTVMLSYSKAF
jgi:hypothetical protein